MPRSSHLLLSVSIIPHVSESNPMAAVDHSLAHVMKLSANVSLRRRDLIRISFIHSSQFNNNNNNTKQLSQFNFSISFFSSTSPSLFLSTVSQRTMSAPRIQWPQPRSRTLRCRRHNQEHRLQHTLAPHHTLIQTHTIVMDLNQHRNQIPNHHLNLDLNLDPKHLNQHHNQNPNHHNQHLNQDHSQGLTLHIIQNPRPKQDLLLVLHIQQAALGNNSELLSTIFEFFVRFSYSFFIFIE